MGGKAEQKVELNTIWELLLVGPSCGRGSERAAAPCTVQCLMCNVHALEANLLKAGRMQIITWLYGTTAYFLDHTLGFLKPGKVKIENESLPTDREGSGAAHTHEQMIWSQPFSAAFLFIRFTNHLFRKKPCKISTKKEVNHWAHEVVKSAWH